MKKSIYLNFKVVAADSADNQSEQSYVLVKFDQMELAIFDLRSVVFVDSLGAYYGFTPDAWQFYLPQRDNGFTLYGVNGSNIVELGADMDKVVKRFFSCMDGFTDYALEIPTFVRFLLTLMSDRQVLDNFKRLYPLYHGFHNSAFYKSHFTR